MSDTPEPKLKVGSPEWRAREHERRIAQSVGRCVFFTGLQHGVCEAGVKYDDVNQRRPGGLPCLCDIRTSEQPDAECPKRRWTTREEAEKEIADSNAAFERVNTCLKAIREKHGKARGLGGSMPCPVGCGGELRYSIAGYNGHVHGRCSTEGCASWMQ